MIPSQFQSIGNHLWQSTLFAGATGLLTLTLRKNRAATRYWLWLAASVKFLIPFSLLVLAGSHFGRQTPAQITPPITIVIQDVSEPFAAVNPAGRINAGQHFAASVVPSVLFTTWAVGFVFVISSWWRRSCEVRAALRAASPLQLPVGIKVMSSTAILEPGVFGILRQALLLPEGIADHLTPAQFDAILAHELCHVRRRDNLSTVLHMLVEALFWFHPLVWWLGARLMREREHACDEEVLRLGKEPGEYAEGILKICELYLESPLRCVSGVTGSNLKERIEQIMANRIQARLSASKKALLAAGGTLAVAFPLVVGVMNAPLRAQTDWQAAAGGRMAFEVASVKPSTGFTPPTFPLDAGNAFTQTGGRFLATFSLLTFIDFAYKITPTADQRQSMLAHLPKWVETDSFVIEARGPSNATKDQFRLMMQSLLADRFKLVAHFESQQSSVFALTLVKPGKLGPNLRPHSEGPPCPGTATVLPPPGPLSSSDVFPPACEMFGMTRTPDGSRFRWGSRNSTMASLASMLPNVPFSGPEPGTGAVDRPVVDRTGLTGTFDFRVDYALQSANPTAPFGVQPDPSGPTFLEALREQLGLRLESAKGQAQTLVIDHIEKPSEN